LEKSQSEVDLYQIRSSVVNIYFGILKVEAQLNQLDHSLETLKAQLQKVTAAVENGVSLPSNRDILQAEILRTEQLKISLLHQRISFLKNLETLTGDSIEPSTALLAPEVENPTYHIKDLNRPELFVLRSGKEAIQAKQAVVDANVKPILGAFFQAGYGKPGLNFLENAFSPYYIAGLNLKWNISQLYTKANDTELNTLDALRIEADEKNFVRNIQVISDQYTTEIERYQSLLEQDERILALRKKITERAEKQLENGVITSSEYIQELNAEERAKIERNIHILEINQLNYQLKNLYGFE
jgi:outer membrane protein TolC